MKRSPLRRVSKKRSVQNAEYSKRRKAFLERHPYCQWWLHEVGVSEEEAIRLNGRVEVDGMHVPVPRSTDIHHMKKPRATYLNDESTWMAVSRIGHDWIESHKSESRKKGYLYDI